MIGVHKYNPSCYCFECTRIRINEIERTRSRNELLRQPTQPATDDKSIQQERHEEVKRALNRVFNAVIENQASISRIQSDLRQKVATKPIKPKKRTKSKSKKKTR